MLILTNLEAATELRAFWLNQIKSNGTDVPPIGLITTQLALIRVHLNVGSLAADERLVLSIAAAAQSRRALWTQSMPCLVYGEAYLEMLEAGFRSLVALSTMDLDEALLRAARCELEASTARAALCLALDAQTGHALMKQNPNFDEAEQQQLAEIYDVCFTERCLTRLTGAAILLLSWLRMHDQGRDAPADPLLGDTTTKVAAALEGSLSSIHSIPSPQVASKRLLTLLTHAIHDLNDDILCELMHLPFFGNMDAMATEDEFPGVTVWELVAPTVLLEVAITRVIVEAQLSISHPNLSMRCTVFVLEDTVLDSARRIQSSLPTRCELLPRTHPCGAGDHEEASTLPTHRQTDRLDSPRTLLDPQPVQISKPKIHAPRLESRFDAIWLEWPTMSSRPVVKRHRRASTSPRMLMRPNLDLERHLDMESLHQTQLPALRLATWRQWVGVAANAPPARRTLLLAALGLPLLDSQWMHLHDHQLCGGLYPVVLHSLYHLLTMWPKYQKKTLDAICDAFGNLMMQKLEEMRNLPIPEAPGLQQRLARLLVDSHTLFSMRDSAGYDRLTTIFKARGRSV
jgi:hypothetical protein